MKKSKDIIVPKYAFSWKSGKNHLFLSWKNGNALLLFSPYPIHHSKKTPIFAHVSLKSIPNGGFRDNFVRK